jgi:hypothetical protein
MQGDYLSESRSEMLEAVEQESAEEHALRSLGALTEAFAELEARVTRIEAGPDTPLLSSPPPE